jgi:hypothetical protein
LTSLLLHQEAGQWGVLLLLYVLAGVGRGIWEAVVKAVFADYFHEEEQPAVFACLHAQSGGSGAIGYFVFPNIGKTIKAWSCILIAMLGYDPDPSHPSIVLLCKTLPLTALSLSLSLSPCHVVFMPRLSVRILNQSQLPS